MYTLREQICDCCLQRGTRIRSIQLTNVIRTEVPLKNFTIVQFSLVIFTQTHTHPQSYIRADTPIHNYYSIVVLFSTLLFSCKIISYNIIAPQSLKHIHVYRNITTTDQPTIRTTTTVMHERNTQRIEKTDKTRFDL